MPTFQNPILSGFHPDPSICRVEDDYYLVTSSFGYFPGLPIFHSRDLIHWRQIGNIIDRLSQVCQESTDPSDGIYAPTLRYHDGLFFAVTTNLPNCGNMIFTAASPAGPWSDPICIANAPGIDPSLFFDVDGSCWYAGNGDPEHALYDGHHTIWLQQFDTETMRLIGERSVIVDGGSDLAKKPIWIEGPHIYKVDDRYYLIAAEGGTGEDHSVVVFRSNVITGPYESFPGNPILTNRGLDPDRAQPITCTGHADLVQTQTGEWWMALLSCRPYPPGDRYVNIGRETFLAPVKWEDDWPAAADGSGRLKLTYSAPNLPESRFSDDYVIGTNTFRDDFDSDALKQPWAYIPTVGDSWLDLTTRPGRLRLIARREEIGGRGSPSFVGVRQRHHDFTAMTAIEFSPTDLGQSAGLAAVQNNVSYYALLVTKQAAGFVVQLWKGSPGGEKELRAERRLASGRLQLRIDGRGAELDFLVAQEPGDWRILSVGEDSRILSTRMAGGFVGTFIGLYAHAPFGPSRSQAEFDWFEYSGHESPRR